MNDERFTTRYYEYQQELFTHTHIPSDTLDITANKLHRELRTTPHTTPFLRQMHVYFQPDVAKHRHKMITLRSKNDLSTMADTAKKHIRAANEAAKALDYASYKAMMFELDNLDEKRIKYGLVQLIGYQGKQRKKLKTKHQINADNFYNTLATIGPKPRRNNPEKIFSKVHRMFEYDSFANFIEIETDSTLRTPSALQISSSKVLIKTPAIHSMWNLKCFIDELSKAIILYYQEDNPVKHFLRPTHIEAFASMLSQTLIQKVCTLTEKRYIRQLQVLENSWHSVHALFEFDLHEKLKSAEEVYKSIVTPIFPMQSPQIWAFNTYTRGELITKHYKPIGHIMHDNVTTIARKDRVMPWKLAPWIKENILRRLDEIGIETLI